MPQKGLISKVKTFLKSRMKITHRQQARVEINLPGLFIKFDRDTDIATPHELTIVIPRAELRKRCLNEDCSKYEYELIYSSITVVDAPSHPIAAPPFSPHQK